MKYPRYVWLLFFLKHGSVAPTERDLERVPLGHSGLRQPGKSMRKMVAGATLSRKNTFNYQINKLKIVKKIYWGTYCKNTYTPEEAEILLNLDMDGHANRGNWWRRRTALGLRKVPNPECSQRPNTETPIITKLSEHVFFQSEIDIPIKEGQKITRLTTYDYFTYAPTWKDFMECDCTVVEGATSAECVRGKISFSRGVGGDSSFFVHVPTSPKRFKVVAHICFD